MKSLVLSALSLACIALGVSISPAVAAGSHPGPWAKIFGHSTSCSLGRASTNDATERGGGLTNNYEGCSASNNAQSVPAGYLRTRELVVNSSNGLVCGDSGTLLNTSTASSRDASTAREYYTTSCESPRNYLGYSYNSRRSDAGYLYTVERAAPAYYFPSWLA